jgi:hypothetical protein
MKCPVQAFVAFAIFIGGCATMPEAPPAAITARLFPFRQPLSCPAHGLVEVVVLPVNLGPLPPFGESALAIKRQPIAWVVFHPRSTESTGGRAKAISNH